MTEAGGHGGGTLPNDAAGALSASQAPSSSTVDRLLSSAAAEHQRLVRSLYKELVAVREQLDQAVTANASVEIDRLINDEWQRQESHKDQQEKPGTNNSLDSYLSLPGMTEGLDAASSELDFEASPAMSPQPESRAASSNAPTASAAGLSTGFSGLVPSVNASLAGAVSPAPKSVEWLPPLFAAASAAGSGRQPSAASADAAAGGAVAAKVVVGGEQRSGTTAASTQRRSVREAVLAASASVAFVEPDVAKDEEAPAEQHAWENDESEQEPEEDVASPKQTKNIIEYSKTSMHDKNGKRVFRFSTENVLDALGIRLPNYHKHKNELDQKMRSRQLWRFMNSAQVKTACAVVILLNAVFIGWHSEAVLLSILNGTTIGYQFAVLEYLFSTWFALELFLRMGAEQCLFFYGPEWKWNAIDSVLVLFSFIEIIGAASMPNFTLARLLRIFRFARILRILRVMRFCQSFRVMVYSILSSMMSLLWVMIVLVFFKYCFAIFFLHGVAEFFDQSQDLAENSADVLALKRDFASIRSILTSLFMAITGGVDWRDMFEPLMLTGVIYGYAFLFYISLMTFVVMNVVVGAVVKTTSHVYNKDKQLVIADEIDRLKEYTQQIKVFFLEADRDKSGTLSWEEFEAHMQDNKVKAFFQSLDLDVSQAHTLFDLLDADGSNEVGVDEFIDGCWRLKGEARSIDVNRQLLMMERINTRLNEVKSTVDQISRHTRLSKASSTTSLGRGSRQKAMSCHPRT